MASIEIFSASDAGTRSINIPISSDGLNIRQEHYDIIQNAIDKVFAKYPTVMNEYRSLKYSHSTVCQKLLFGAGIDKWIKDNLSYLTRSDINHALERICPTPEQSMKSPRYPLLCRSMFCGQIDCTGCKQRPVLLKYKSDLKQFRSIKTEQSNCMTRTHQTDNRKVK